jgi:hypothetical protein
MSSTEGKHAIHDHAIYLGKWEHASDERIVGTSDGGE